MVGIKEKLRDHITKMEGKENRGGVSKDNINMTFILILPSMIISEIGANVKCVLHNIFRCKIPFNIGSY